MSVSPLQRRLLRHAPHATESQPDALHLRSSPLVPEIRLLVAEDPFLLWARLEAEVGAELPAPFWATAWSGGQALARYLFDHPAQVAGRRVLDVASGSGLVAIAAVKAGAAEVTANDIDPYAIAAIHANTELNDCRIAIDDRDLTGGDGGDAEVILIGDGVYDRDVAARVVAFAVRAAARGATVLLGSPERGHMPVVGFETLATYHHPGMGVAEYGDLESTSVLTPAAAVGAVTGPGVQG
jgi:predicted nicotinamide N-methyase